MPRAPSRKRKVKCQNCGKDFFTRHSQGKWCPDKCRRLGERKSWREYGYRNKDARREHQKKMYINRREEIIERTTKYRKTKAGKRAQRITDARNKIKFPEKIFARQEVMKAVKRGDLQKNPCERCGERKVHGHHTDYSKPLQVIWLCVKHHNEAHKGEQR